MVMQDRKWLGAGADIAIRAAFSLCMCGAVAGLLYLTAQNGQADASTSAEAAPHVATVVATLDAPQPVSTQTVEMAAVTPPSPLVASAPTAKPALSDIHAVIPLKRPEMKQKLAATSREKVERFNTCLPDCETRDPMVIGQSAGAVEPAYTVPAADVALEEPVALPFAERAGTIIDRALDVPGDAFRKGRSLIVRVAHETL